MLSHCTSLDLWTAALNFYFCSVNCKKFIYLVHLHSCFFSSKRKKLLFLVSYHWRARQDVCEDEHSSHIKIYRKSGTYVTALLNQKVVLI